MRKKSWLKKILCLVLAATLVFGVCVSVASCDKGQNDEEVWIGPY